MRAPACLFWLFILASLPSTAQEVPRVQVFGGYSYLRFDSRSFGFANGSNLNGYTLAPAFNLTRNFGVVAELSGQYGSHLNLRDIAAGPQFLYLRNNTLFSGHVLIGESRTFVSVGNTGEDTARAIVVGGSADHSLSPRFAWRVVQVDYVYTSLFNRTQNNFRISTGLVYHWGEIKEKGHKRRRAPTP
jgi:hypothetical protein